MSETPFMPLWVNDFLGDTLDLNATEIGAYMILLMAQWQRKGGSLPLDEKKLQRISRCGRNWPTVWAALRRFFSEDDAGFFNKRLRLEAQICAAKRDANARSGSRGGRAKALKNKQTGLANATNSLWRKSSIPEPEPNREIDTSVSISPQRKRSGVSDPPGFADFWEAYPRKIAKGAAREAWIMAASLTDPPTIIAAASRVEDRGRYTPNPATWLNAERWLDQTENRNDQRSSTPGNGHAILDAAARASARFATPGTDPRGPGGSGGCAAGMDSGARGDAAGASFPARRSGTSH